MGIFSKFFKKKPEPRLPGVERDEHGRFIDVKVELIKATTDDKPTTIPSEYAKAVVQKQKAASKTKPLTDAENKKAPAKKPSTKKKPNTK
jgi:hypothetical protein